MAPRNSGGRARELFAIAIAVAAVAAVAAALILTPHLASDGGRNLAPLPQALGVHSCPGSQLGLAQIESPEARAAVLCLINAERSARGLSPLAEEGRLDAGAIAYARLMRDRDFFAHDGVDGSTPESRILAAGYPRGPSAGENLAWGQRESGTPSAIVRAWMDSPGHRENILRPQFKFIGIGIVRGSPLTGRDDDGAAIYVTPFGG